MSTEKIPDVVVLLPGILGSVLKKDGKVVWGYSATTIGRALFTLGRSVRQGLSLTDDDWRKDDLGDGVVADSLMPDLHLLPGLWKIDGYGKVTDTLLETFALTPGQNFFCFPYDWRRDNRAAARRLATASRGWLESWRESSGNQNAKLILIGHSMGGLVSRYFLECMEGWKHTRALITFGTPYRGSLNALDSLSNGMAKGPVDLSSLARQLTSLYQLLPVYECYDAGDGKQARVGQTKGIPNVDATMAAAALAFHEEIRAAVDVNRAIPAYQAGAYQLFPIVGVAQQTLVSARLVNGKVTLSEEYKGVDGTIQVIAGDGTVPRASAIPYEMSDAPHGMYAATKHGSLQNADAVLAHLLGLVSGLYIDLGGFKKAHKPRTEVALQVGDVFFAGEEIPVSAAPKEEGVSLLAQLFRSDEEQPIATRALQPVGGLLQQCRFAPPGPGAFRVRVSGTEERSVEAAEEAFAVAQHSERDCEAQIDV